MLAHKWIIGLLFTFLSITTINTVQADAPIEGRAGRAEVRFMQGMINHHQMALDMANDCLSKANDETILAICQNIIELQSEEIASLQSWLLAWYNIAYSPISMLDTSHDTGHDGHNMGDQPFTDPPMTMGMMAGLNRLEGTAYEIAWLEAMIDHHDDAIHMAERISRFNIHPELQTLAEAIISAQTQEIDSMEVLIATLGS